MPEQTERIPQHRHCAGCGRAFVGEGRFCGEACREESGKEVKGKLRKLMLIWAAIVVVTVVLVFMMEI
ncbi:MAG: DUF2116 family Zn-ribbon domain-containing protein [Candidatus Methanomethylophilaceae archaeon]|nr:DUF2116 family Zn-ribbon domain-containing protein [Candidatus Methanomethylophilaceae archaeon]